MQNRNIQPAFPALNPEISENETGVPNEDLLRLKREWINLKICYVGNLTKAIAYAAVRFRAPINKLYQYIPADPFRVTHLQTGLRMKGFGKLL